MVMPVTSEAFASVRYGVPRWNPAWAVPEVPVPESDLHDDAINYLQAVLKFWAGRSPGNHRVFRNLGLRWVQEEPRAGFDPDLCLIQNAPKEEDGVLSSYALWRPDRPTPRLAIEVVSPSHPYKDYIDTPERAAASGVPELWVYDPLMKGPNVHGGPFLLQVFRTTEAGYTRVHAGPGPAYSPELDAFLHPTETRVASQAKLCISADREGRQPFLTGEEHREQERLTERQGRLAAEEARLAAQQARQAAEERVRELEEQLKWRGGGRE